MAAPSKLRTWSHGLRKQTGLDPKQFFEAALTSNVARVLSTRLNSLRFRAIVEAEDLRHHYADIEIGESRIAVQRSFIAARLEFIDRCLGASDIDASTFIDVGDSNGIFLRALGKRGIGLNYTEGCTANLMARGVTAVRGDAVSLPLADGACDYTFCFETLEHLTDPIGAIRELVRVSRKGVFISVPRVSRTTVRHAGYQPGPQPLLHIFELSEAHWRALFTHAGATVRQAAVAPVVGPPRGLRERVAMAAWRAAYGPDVYCGTFREFQLFLLDARPSVAQESA